MELSVTLTDSVGNGYLSVCPGGAPRPATSNVNWFGNVLKAENVIVPVGANGEVDLYNGDMPGSATDIVVDVSGYFSASGASLYVPVTPTRILDTRPSSGPAAGNGEVDPSPSTFGMAGTATAFAVNATVTQTETGAGRPWARTEHRSRPRTSTG